MISTVDDSLQLVELWHEHGMCDGVHNTPTVSPACVLAVEVTRQQRIIAALILMLGRTP